MGSGYFGMYGDTIGSRGLSALLLEPPCCWLPLAGGGGGDMIQKKYVCRGERKRKNDTGGCCWQKRDNLNQCIEIIISSHLGDVSHTHPTKRQFSSLRIKVFLLQTT